MMSAGLFLSMFRCSVDVKSDDYYSSRMLGIAKESLGPFFGSQVYFQTSV
jgi:hypothetical protein